MNSEEVRAQIESITTLLVECSLCDEQNFPSVRRSGRHTLITVPNDPDLAIALKSGIDYREIYRRLEETRSFNFRMLDGAIVQLLYDFIGDDLVGHRLSYFPSPSLEPFQNEPELYENDEIYAEVLKKNIVPFPIRFDYSSDDEKHIEVNHPKSHMTLGQYQNCRIPVFSPVTPIVFAKFMLRNFYNTAYCAYESRISIQATFFPGCITENEQGIPHLVLSRDAA
ncbi:DUF2290 domain-containing protein [Xanthomonas euvesicatoria]|uniref:DUF2290 domain-containing protein n=1 Tax=Xanthomonas euvesicatoria TaxID=456327 RepID=UPI002406A37F|nr:DUF2290 domain-containing protein [Xanthomonas euvesicatoria]MCC8913491.1 DUF2290 domain-containing protein [Xanthomonas euvesicatoria]